MMNLETLLKDYHNHVNERANDNIPPLPLNAEQTNIVIELLEKVDTSQSDYLVNLLQIEFLTYSKLFSSQ